MFEFLPLSIGLGLAVSLLFSELFGVAVGGMIVPGYLALFLTKPLDIALTIVGGLATYAIVHALSALLIVYGRRRTVLMILVGYLMGMLLRMVTKGLAPFGEELAVIGYIVPGLIAIWLDRQGIIVTLSSLLTASAVVRLLLIIFIGAEIGP